MRSAGAHLQDISILAVKKRVQNLEIWKSALAGLPLFARKQFEGVIDTATPPEFCHFIVETLESDAETGRRGTLSDLLLRNSLAAHAVSSPEICPLPEALRVARAAVQLDTRFDCQVLDDLTRPSRAWPEEVPEGEIAQVLAVVDAISDCSRLVLPLMKFSKLPHPHLRSKAVKLMARGTRNPGWINLILADADPRVRANLVEGVAAQIPERSAQLLRRAAHDPYHRVALTALLALCRNGDQASYEEIKRLADDRNPKLRKAAAWALRQL